MSSIPFGVWCGIAIVLLAAWAQDVRGIVIGVVLIAATAAAIKFRPPAEEPGAPTAETDRDL